MGVYALYQKKKMGAKRKAEVVATTSKKARFNWGGSYRNRSNRPGPSEYKFIEGGFTASSLPVSTTGQVTWITGCAAGTDFSNRVGRKIAAKHVELIIELILNTSTTYDNIKVSLVQERKHDTTRALPPDYTEIYDTGLNGLAGMGMRNLARAEDYLVLKSEQVCLNAAGSPTEVLKWYVPLNDLQITYEDTTGLQIMAGCNHLYVCIGGCVTGAGFQSLARLTYRVKFVDP